MGSNKSRNSQIFTRRFFFFHIFMFLYVTTLQSSLLLGYVHLHRSIILNLNHNYELHSMSSTTNKRLFYIRTLWSRSSYIFLLQICNLTHWQPLVDVWCHGALENNWEAFYILAQCSYFQLKMKSLFKPGRWYFHQVAPLEVSFWSESLLP